MNVLASPAYQLACVGIVELPVEDAIGANPRWPSRRPKAVVCTVRLPGTHFFFVDYSFNLARVYAAAPSLLPFRPRLEGNTRTMDPPASISGPLLTVLLNRHSSQTKSFVEFLKAQFCIENLLFWWACEDYKLLVDDSSTNPTWLRVEARAICNTFVVCIHHS